MSDNEPHVTLTAAASGRQSEAVRRFRIDVLEGPAGGVRWSSQADACAIGSHEKNDLCIADPTVSRFHCEIRVESGQLRVRDLGSRNGTTVDGVTVIEAFARDGATIGLGTTKLRVKTAAELNVLPASERRNFGSLVGESVEMRMAFAALEAAAASDATVILRGETGTGKELAAVSLHEESGREGGPFIVVDCAALPSQLLESELFGHERGAFTGADARRIGAFEAASGGTIFIDEIGELPLEMQPKLLRVLERRQIRRLGSNEFIDVDVRVVSATHRDLREEVNRDRFRADLYYRLAVIGVVLPPLRQRPDDIPELAAHILVGLGADEATRTRLGEPAFIAALKGASWPGNVRELRNYLERCVVFGQAMPVEVSSESEPGQSLSVDPRVPFHIAKRGFTDRFERAYIERLLELHDGKVTVAAKTAGIGRVLLWKLCTKHGLGRQSD